MLRLILPVACLVCFSPLVTAELSPPKETFGHESRALDALARRQAKPKPAPAKPVEPSSPFTITDTTEVLLDGKPCPFADIPGHASIILIEVGSDKRTILKIHFRTQR
jgi:hypothetical protein